MPRGRGAFIEVGLLVWGGSTLLVDAWWRRWDRPDLAERLLPFQPGSVVDEAQHWLNEQS
jgi:hypothetical protein